MGRGYDRKDGRRRPSRLPKKCKRGRHMKKTILNDKDESLTGKDVFTFEEEVEVSLPQLKIERESNRKAIPVPSSRRLVDLCWFVEKIREVERHSMECSFGGSLILVSSINKGLCSSLKFECFKLMCTKTITFTTVENPTEVKRDVVQGCISTGVGYYQAEELFSVLDTPFMANGTYQKYEKSVGENMKRLEQQSMLNAISEEKSAAVRNGDVTEEGHCKITVIIDGGWSKRSYGHAYNANSGVAVIIGDHTKKILFAGVRNKFCITCRLQQNEIVKHNCNCNWRGTSTAMEADIVVEGLLELYENHNIMCTKIIGDGDSSVMKRIRERIPYATSTGISKIECTNHLVKNLHKKLCAISENTKAFPGKSGLAARKLLKSKISIFVDEIREVINSHALLLQSDPTKCVDTVQSLKNSIRNIHFHIFDEHSKCNGKPCATIAFDQSSYIETLKYAGVWGAIDEALIHICCLSDSLILQKTSNAAENFMSQVAKTTGGKRVDFSKGQGYSRRVSAAILAHSFPGHRWHYQLKDCPKSPVKRLIIKRSRKLETNRKGIVRRKLFTSHKPVSSITTTSNANKRDLDYGACDVNEQVLQQLSQEFYTSRVCVTKTKAVSIEERTRGQCNNLWHQERRIRLTASRIKAVASRRSTTLSAPLVTSLLYPPAITNSAVKWGKVFEDVAKRQYEQKNNIVVKQCGLFIDVEYPFLAATPDGLVETSDGNKYIVEIKCPYAARTCQSISDACATVSSFPLRKQVNGDFFLPKTHAYFYQVQLQLRCTNLQRCDFVVYIPNDLIILTIYRDVTFIDNLLPKFKKFYTECVLPELVDSRANRGLPLREPSSILKARAAWLASKSH